MKKPLKQVINNKIIEHKLSDQQLADLQKLQSPAQAVHGDIITNRFKLAGMLASVIVATLLLTMFMPGQNTNVPVQESMLQKIAHEVVKNHLHLKPLEVHTNNIDGLIHYFTQLDFLLRPSREVSDFGDNLLGGRYCSLQGITAAQLRLSSPHSKRSKADTLYQTEYRKSVFGELPDIDKDQAPAIAWAKGIKVKVWVEKGILFAVTDVSATGH